MRIRHSRNVVPEKCTVCGGALKLGGPIWNSYLHKKHYVERLYEKSKAETCELKTKERI